VTHVIGVIPARYASTRFPGKLLADLQGKSILQRTFESARRSSTLDQILIATDDQRIKQAAENFGAEVVMTRIDCPSGTDRVAEAIEGLDADIVINIQGDEPCVSPEAIDAVARRLLESPEAPMATALFPLSDEERNDSSIVKCVVDQSGRALYFSRAPIPTPYGHLGIYGYRPAFLRTYVGLPPSPQQETEDLEQLRALEHGYSIVVAHVEAAHPGVNTPEDLKRLEQLLCNQNMYS